MKFFFDSWNIPKWLDYVALVVVGVLVGYLIALSI